MEIELQLKATAALAAQIKKELEDDSADTTGLFGTRSNKTDTEDSESPST
jgi:hypothetical protein